EIGDKLEVVMIPKVEGPWDIHYADRLLAQLEAKAGLDRPILVHAILETHLGVANLEEIAAASPRIQGMSFGPADLAASRRMKTTRVGGGHPGYRTIADPDPDDPQAPRAPERRQDAGRRDLEAVQGDGQPRRNARAQGPGAGRGLRLRPRRGGGVAIWPGMPDARRARRRAARAERRCIGFRRRW